MERRLESPLTYYTVTSSGELRKHTLKQLELPFGPSDPGRVVKIRPADQYAETVEDLDDQDNETEAVIRD